MQDTLQSIMELHRDSPLPLAVADRQLSMLWANRAALAIHPQLAQPDGLRLMLPSGGATSLSERLFGERRPLCLPLVKLALSLTPIEDLALVQFAQIEEGGSALHPEGGDLLLTAVTGQLRTPLAGIFASVSAIAQIAELNEDERLGELGGLINQNSYQLLRFTSELTSYLRALNGAGAAAKTPIDLRELLSNLCDAASILVRSVGIKFTSHLPDEPVLLSADADALLTALLHLISNSCRFTRQDNHIELTLSKGERTAVVTVADRGRGIPAELTGRVFEPFFSHDMEGLPCAGTGLGLTLVRYIVARHGGTVALTSTEGQGTSVAMSLPLSDSSGLTLQSVPRVADLLRDRFSPLHVILCDSCGVPLP